jgi:uncharacterized protein (TIGR03118 family)
MSTRLRVVGELTAVLLVTACGSGGMGAPSGRSPVMAQAGAGGAAASGAHPGEREGHFAVRNLVSDGFVAAEHTDLDLVNAWGLAHTATSPWWVSDNGTGLTTLYDGEGVARSLVVTVAGAGGAAAAPTGAVANPTTTDFPVASGNAMAPARFIFASEDGTISGWNPGVPPPPTSTTTVVAVDHSSSDPLGGAVYKGLAVAVTASGARLYATDFRGGKVDVFDGGWNAVAAPGAFVDPRLPAGYAPFGIAVIGDQVVVTYAVQDDARHDDVAGGGHGIVDAFATDGTFLRRVASHGRLDSPWGVALAPATFGPAAGRLLIGNFGDGRIQTFPWPGPGTADGEGEVEGGPLRAGRGPLVIDGLWGLAFGNDAAAGPSDALFFSAGPGGEAHGLFGRIDWVPETGSP